MENVVYALYRNGRVLVQYREEGKYAGLTIFPGGQIEAGETPADAARREILEEVGISVDVVIYVTRTIGDFGEALHVFLVHCGLFSLGVDGEDDLYWMPLESMEHALSIAPSTREIARLIATLV